MSITKTLTSLSRSPSSAGRPISDTEMLRWANQTAQQGNPSVQTIRSFKDPSITTGLYFLSLLEAIRPGIVDPDLVLNVAPTGDYEERRVNGQYCSSIKSYYPADILISSEIGHIDCS